MTFTTSKVVFELADDALIIKITIEGDAGLAKICDVVDRHLRRFAFREDLEIVWTEPSIV